MNGVEGRKRNPAGVAASQLRVCTSTPSGWREQTVLPQRTCSIPLVMVSCRMCFMMSKGSAFAGLASTMSATRCSSPLKLHGTVRWTGE
jgi:hypothetical protein